MGGHLYLKLITFLIVGVFLAKGSVDSESVRESIEVEDAERNFIRVGDMNVYRGKQRAGIQGMEWPKNTIPYTWHESIDRERKRLIRDAMKDLEKVVPHCWRFVKRTHQKHWVEYQNLKDECFSDLGNVEGVGDTPQIVNFGGEACNPGGMIHELFHTLGMSHEHSRDDRDYYISPVWDNIPDDPGMMVNFKKDKELGYTSDTYGLPYNFLSIMQYGFFLSAPGIDPEKPVYVNHRNNTAKNWDVDDRDVGQAQFLTREDILVLARQGKCKEPLTERYNITNAKPDDRNTIGGGRHSKKHGLELKFDLKIKS